MTVRLIASAVIAALLLIGFTPSVPQTSEPAITTQAPAAEVPNDAKAAPAPAQAATVAAEEAEKIALAHAGLAKDRVRGLRAELDLDDGVAEYEVEFTADGYEYDYEIDAASGKIRFWDKELDD